MIAVIIIVTVILAIAYFVTNHLNSDEVTTNDQSPQLTKEELQNIELAEQLYDKDLRPVVTDMQQSNRPQTKKKPNTGNKKQPTTPNK